MNSSTVHPISFEHLEQVVLPIVTVASDARWHPIGTAFVIAVLEPTAALLLTASHNLHFIHQKIDAPRDRHHPTAVSDFLPEPQLSRNLPPTYVVARNGAGIVLAQMIRSWSINDFDVALMLVKIRPDEEMDFRYQFASDNRYIAESQPTMAVNFQYRFALDSRLIAEGTPIMAVGYPRMTADFTIQPNDETQDFQLQLNVPLQTRRGRVIRVCPQGAGINRWPGFLVDAAFDSGMSGGPVIDLSGAVPLVRGIVGTDVSETLEHGAEGSGAQAFASMLWPAMVIETQAARADEDGRLVPENCQLLDLVRHGLIADHGRAHEHVKLCQTGNGLECLWTAGGSEP